MENGTRAPTPHVALLPTPGMGHLIPLAELAKRLVAAPHGFSVTIVTFASTASKTQRAFLSSLPRSISSLSLPPVPLDDLPADAHIETLMSHEAARSVPALAALLRGLKAETRLVAFVADLFGADTLDAAREVGVPGYLFFPSNLHLLSLLLHLPSLDASTTCEFRDLPGPVELPGCVPIPGSEILDPLQDRSNECYRWMVHHGARYREARGILVNTFEAIEPGPAAALRAEDPARPPVYPVGPLVQSADPAGPDPAGCVAWLDEQPPGSVLFVSFGSGGTLTTEQMRELALGLEMSSQRFLWVVRSPSDKGEVSAAYYDAESKGDPFAYLPEGFAERTKRVGKVVSSWAPQMRVLGHEATGGFLTHCGWNSTLESVVSGVPMIAWPLYAEQRQNAIVLVGGVGAALRPKRAAAAAVVGREEVAEVVRELMEGEAGKKVRAKVRELKEAAQTGLSEDGAAYEALLQVAGRWKQVN
ncbi:hydroquinone glucosyltransferase [Ananas comosus]|uniref:Glycosyltransferase n=1 Tax=Ananas comosus TaxID=4615 RepID=A0A199V201_ANACO|nr:hydroquinone glucosyltransferase [Ananas comosus]OAY71013.1 Hydroquinone glucosyltransferase [Ananas comosus]